MIGHIVDIEQGRYILLYKAGEAYLRQNISDTPSIVNNTIDMIYTDSGSMYLGQEMAFGPLGDYIEIAIADDRKNLVANLLTTNDISFFILQIVKSWSASTPAWVNERIKTDLIEFMKWRAGEVDSLTNQP